MLPRTFDESFARVGQLVSTFKQNEKQYLSPDYIEAQARLDFIDKFWVALGWDVYHEQQKNPYEQEVKVERSVKVKGRKKKADYTFLAPNFRDVRFFVEAKKPARNIDNPDDYFQTIRYGWNAQAPISILTDFEQFRILDCRYKPDVHVALHRALKKFHYTEYADADKFSEIYFLLSREAVTSGALEKFAKTLPKSTGKAAQRKLFAGAYKSVDEEFLQELDALRDELARSFKIRNQHLNGEDLTEATQRTLDRLVFMRFLEDKLIEPEAMVERLGERGAAWADFVAESERLNRIYNGIIFKPHFIDKEDFIVDECVFADVRERLSHTNTVYNFNYIPIHVLGSIYERFLGKVIVATDKRAHVEEKPEVRKAGGVYYTPEYIVRYIVEQTVGCLIEGQTPEEIALMRFADIACGSGSFLLGMYDELLRYHTAYYNEPKNRRKAIKAGCIETSDGSLRLSLNQRKDILLNNIFGVDLDAQAVEVAQLSLFLKLLEDETTASARGFQLQFRETMLPSLDKNVVHGNSLIGWDIGGLFSDEDERKLFPMDFEQAFPEVMRRGGFDAIVGNPPYGALLGNETAKYLQKKFVAASYQLDSYPLFIETAIHLIKENGRCGLIIPSAWVASKYNDSLRRLIVNQTTIDSIVIAPRKVFRDAVVETLLLTLSKGDGVEDSFQVERWDVEGKPIYEVSTNSIKQTPDFVFPIYASPEMNKVIHKLKQNTAPLSDYAEAIWGVKIYQRGKGIPPQKGIEADCKIFHSLEKTKESHLPLLGGKEVHRYFIQWEGRFVDYGRWLAEPRTPDWFTGPRILVREVTSKGVIQAAIVDSEYVFSNSVDGIRLINDNYSINFILGVINSKLISFFHSKTSANAFKETFPKVLIKDLLSLPVPNLNLRNKADRERHDRMVNLVEQMLTSKRQLQTSRTDRDRNHYENRCAALDRQIDALVYEIYGLTDEEVAIVEAND